MIKANADRPLLVIGAGGHARVVIDVARAAGFTPIAALDSRATGSLCNGVPVVGGDDQAAEYRRQGLTECVIAIGDNRVRMKLAEQMQRAGMTFPAVVHPSTILSPSALIGAGTVIMPLAVVNAAASIGEMVVINSLALVEHDCVIGVGVHIAPGCRLGGTVSVGEGTLIGIGTIIRPGASVGAFAVVGAGSTVIGNLASNTVSTGCPARPRDAW